VHGIPLTDFIQQNPTTDDKRTVWRILSVMVGKMVLLHNFIHQDLHPGNMMVSIKSVQESCSGGCFAGCKNLKKKITVTLIDAGMALDVKAQRRSFFSRMFSEGLRQDPDSAGNTFLKLHKDLGYAQDVVLEKNFVRKIGALVVCAIYPRNELADEAFGSKELSDEARLPQIFSLLINVFKTHQVVMDPEIWSVFSTLSIVEMSLRTLFNGNVLENVVPLMGLKLAQDMRSRVPCLPGRESKDGKMMRIASEASCMSGVTTAIKNGLGFLFGGPGSQGAQAEFRGEAALDSAINTRECSPSCKNC
jgi:predicted unusual protein kinase regulating ubiquinone biosynthesis (AarF/ABC1/UbiB family)